MLAQNPKKEVTVNFNLDDVRNAILKLAKKDCVLVKNDTILNEITFHDKESLGVGYHVTFTLLKKGETETNVIIEVSRNLSTINTSTELGIANNKLKRFTAEFSAFLSGDVNPETGKANIPQQGCMVVLLFIVGIISIGSFTLFVLL